MSNEKKSVLENILMEDEEEENTKPDVNTLQDTIKEIGKHLNEYNPKRKSNLNHTNVSGLIQAECLNEYMQRNWSYRFDVLDCLIINARDYPISVKGFGIEKFIDGIRSINASFEQTQLPESMRNLMRR
jgi:type IV secretory pathway VirB4 component